MDSVVQRFLLILSKAILIYDKRKSVHISNIYQKILSLIKIQDQWNIHIRIFPE
jgi:hypothetical protein